MPSVFYRTTTKKGNAQVHRYITSKWKPSFKAIARKILEETVLDNMYASLRVLRSWFFSFQEVKSHQPRRAPSSLPENTFHSPLQEKQPTHFSDLQEGTRSHWNRRTKQTRFSVLSKACPHLVFNWSECHCHFTSARAATMCQPVCPHKRPIFEDHVK